MLLDYTMNYEHKETRSLKQYTSYPSSSYGGIMSSSMTLVHHYDSFSRIHIKLDFTGLINNYLSIELW